MPSTGTIILEYVCPALGMIIGNVMFAAPVKKLHAAVERGSLGDLNPTPWAFMTGNCLGWVAYAFFLDNLFVFFANAPGFVLSVWLNLCAAKLQYAQHREEELRQSLTKYLKDSQNKKEDGSTECSSRVLGPEPERESLQEKVVDVGKVVWQVTSQRTPAPAPHEKVVVFIVLVWVAIISIISFGVNRWSHSTRETIVGVCVNINLLFFYGAPLSTIWTVLKTQNSATIHIWTMATNTANGSFWTAFGIATSNPFIYVPNGIGAGLGLVQLVLILVFPRVPVEGADRSSAEMGQSPPQPEGRRNGTTSPKIQGVDSTGTLNGEDADTTGSADDTV